MAMLAEGDRILPAGTLVHIQGMPVRLESEAKFHTHPGNWSVIDDFAKSAAVGCDASGPEEASYARGADSL